MAVDGLEVQWPHSHSLMVASVPSESPHPSGNPYTSPSSPWDPLSLWPVGISALENVLVIWKMGSKKITRKRVKLLGLWKSETVGSNILPGGFPPSQALIQSVEGFGFEICLLNSETSYRLVSTPSHEALSDSGFHLRSQSRKNGW